MKRLRPTIGREPGADAPIQLVHGSRRSPGRELAAGAVASGVAQGRREGGREFGTGFGSGQVRELVFDGSKPVANRAVLPAVRSRL